MLRLEPLVFFASADCAELVGLACICWSFALSFSSLACLRPPPALAHPNSAGGRAFYSDWVTATSLESLRAGHDLEDLLGDLRLASAVHLQRQIADQLAGILRRIAHRRHSRAVLGGRRLKQGAEDGDLDIVGNQARQNHGGVGLIVDGRRATILLVLLLPQPTRRLVE